MIADRGTNWVVARCDKSGNNLIVIRTCENLGIVTLFMQGVAVSRIMTLISRSATPNSDVRYFELWDDDTDEVEYFVAYRVDHVVLEG